MTAPQGPNRFRPAPPRPFGASGSRGEGAMVPPQLPPLRSDLGLLRPLVHPRLPRALLVTSQPLSLPCSPRPRPCEPCLPARYSSHGSRLLVTTQRTQPSSPGLTLGRKGGVMGGESPSGRAGGLGAPEVSLFLTHRESIKLRNWHQPGLEPRVTSSRGPSNHPPPWPVGPGPSLAAPSPAPAWTQPPPVTGAPPGCQTFCLRFQLQPCPQPGTQRRPSECRRRWPGLEPQLYHRELCHFGQVPFLSFQF